MDANLNELNIIQLENLQYNIGEQIKKVTLSNKIIIQALVEKIIKNVLNYEDTLARRLQDLQKCHRELMTEHQLVLEHNLILESECDKHDSRCKKLQASLDSTRALLNDAQRTHDADQDIISSLKKRIVELEDAYEDLVNEREESS